MTIKEDALVQLIARAVTGRYASSLDGIALDALDMIGDELNVLTFALNPDNCDTMSIPEEQLLADLSYLGMRASGISALLTEAKAGRLNLTDDDEKPADESKAVAQ